MVPLLRARLRKTLGPAVSLSIFSDPIRRRRRRRQICRTRRAPIPPRRRLTRHRPVRLPRRRLRPQIPRSDDRVRAELGLKLKHQGSTDPRLASLRYRRRSLAALPQYLSNHVPRPREPGAAMLTSPLNQGPRLSPPLAPQYLTRSKPTFSGLQWTVRSVTDIGTMG